MKRTWKVGRHFQPCPDGVERWDRAYQSILQWARTAQQAARNESVVSSQSAKESDHASRRLRAGLDPATSAKSKY